MRAFVTGASGFVGRRLAARLSGVEHGGRGSARVWQVAGCDSELDVADAAAMRGALRRERPDAVVHLAAQSSVPASLEDPMGCFRTNVLGTRSVLAAVAAEVPRARVLVVGSGDCYGAAEPGAPPVREGDGLRPGSPYSITKWAAEQWALAAERDGLDVVCVRPFNHTGAGQSDRFVASSFARQVAALAARTARGEEVQPLRVGNLASVRDFLHVDDVIDAYVRLLDPSVPAGLYNIASGVGRSIQSLLDRLLELAGVRAAIEVESARWRPTNSLVGDATRLRDTTGWQPTRSFDRALSELLAHWTRVDSPGVPVVGGGA